MKLGKKIGKTRYIHAFLISRLPKYELAMVIAAFRLVPSGFIPDVIKINMDYPISISFLSYPGFYEEEFPKLKASWMVKWVEQPPLPYHAYDMGEIQPELTRRDYNADNPPIIHRKELMYPHPPKEWAKLTEQLENVGAFKDVRSIGYLKRWEEKLDKLGVYVQNYKVKTK